MAADNGNPEMAAAAPRPRLLQQVRDAIRRKHFSPRTEESYVHWIRRFVHFHGKRHPAELGEAGVTAFLNHLARDRHVAAATQNQALSALLFLYREVMNQPLAWLNDLDRAKRPARVPSVLTLPGGTHIRRVGRSRWSWPAWVRCAQAAPETYSVCRVLRKRSSEPAVSGALAA